MRLEEFPVELWLDICDYVHPMQVVHSFHNLNAGIESVLIRSLSDRTVYLNWIDPAIYEQLIINLEPKLRSICITHSESNWQQIAGGLRDNYHLNHFTAVKSLVFDNLPSIRLLETSIEQCQMLRNLTHLNIKNVARSSGFFRIHALVERIWSLPVLKDLKISTTELEYSLSFDADETSTSLLSVELHGFVLKNAQWVKLLRRTPNVQKLSVQCACFDQNETKETFTSVTELYLIYQGSFQSLQNGLRLLPNLENFTLEVTLDVTNNGSVWEEFLVHHLTELEHFRFHLQYQLKKIPEEVITSITGSFSSSFWREILQAEIRFDLMNDSSDHLHCYTIPSIINNLDHLKSQRPVHSVTNDGTLKPVYTFDKVTEFDDEITPLETLQKLSFQLNKIKTLALNFPITEGLHQTIPRFDHVRHLKAKLADDPNAPRDLSELIERIPRLESLTFVKAKMEHIFETFVNIPEHYSITELNLRCLSYSAMPEYLDSAQCDLLMTMAVVKQCRVLFLRVSDLLDVVRLIQGLEKLRLLVVKCPSTDSATSNTRKARNNDQINFLKNELPSSFVIDRETNLYAYIRIWIR